MAWLRQSYKTNMQVNCTIHTFVAQPKGKSMRHVLLLLSPALRIGSLAERLFMIADFAISRTKEAETRIESARLFGSQLFSHYREYREAQTKNEECFEKLLEWANRHVNQFIEFNEVETPPAMIIGRSTGIQLFFSVSGSPSAFIYFKDGNIFRELDLIQTYGGTSAQKTSAPFFYTLINGELYADNYVLLSTMPLYDILQPRVVERYITEYDGADAVDALIKQLHNAAPHLAVAGILLSYPGARPKIHPRDSSSFALSTVSIKRLIQQGQATNKLLDVSFFAKLKSTLLPHLLPRKSTANSDLSAEMRQAKTVANKRGILPQLTARRILSAASHAMEYLLFNLGKTLTISTRQIYAFFRGSAQERHNRISALYRAARSTISNLLTQWRRLNTKQKIIFAVVMVSGGIIILNAAGFAVRAKNARISAAYTAQYNTIKEKLDGIESMIIYNDMVQARMEARMVQSLISTFPADSAKHKTTQAALQKSLDMLLLKLRHITNVSPLLIADFGALNPGELSMLISGGNSVTALGTGSRAFTGVIATGEIKQINIPLIGDGAINAKTARDINNFILAAGERRLINLQMPSNAATSLEMPSDAKPQNIKALGFYNEKLYLVDGARGMIVKHESSTDGFGKGIDWLRAARSDLAQTSALTIDGTIYVGLTNGTLYKFINGKGKRESLDLLDPPLKTITALYTTKDSPLLFILDAADKRIVLWDKKGILKAQFTSEKFERLKDFVVDEKTREITALDGTRVWRFRY